MTLQASGPISLFDIRDELGLTGAFSIQSAEARDLAGVPTGAISLFDFYGKSAIPNVVWDGLGNLSYSIFVVTGTATCAITFNPDGTMSKDAGVIGTTPDWLDTTGTGQGSEFRIHKTFVSGLAVTGPTVSTSLATAQTFSISSSSGAKTGTINIVISHKDAVGPFQGRQVSFTAESGIL